MSDPTLRAAIALYDRFTHEGMDRRAFMTELTRIAGGSAAAAMLLSSVACRAAAPQVPPDAPGIHVTDVLGEATGGRTYNTYQATPENGAGGETPIPAVIVIHENRGLNDHIRDVTRRLAVAGYQALAPDFLSGAGGTPADEDRAREMIGQLDMPQIVADGAEMVRRLRVSQGTPRKVGIVGFCWGGAMVHRIALAAGGNLSAAVSFYGPAPDPAEAPRLVAPELVILAGRDARVNATAGPWVAALRAAGKDVSEITYPEVDHAFHNDTSAARYNRAAAEQAWTATLDFFRRHLGA